MSRRIREPCSQRGIDPCQSPMNRSILRSCGARSAAYLTNSGPGYELIPLMAFLVPLEGGGVCAITIDVNRSETKIIEAKTLARVVKTASLVLSMMRSPLVLPACLFVPAYFRASCGW